MAPTHVALLRGINVGKAKRLSMTDLRAAATAVGLGDVATLLNSGNLVFSLPRGTTAAAARERLEGAIAERAGIQSKVTVLSAAEVATILAENPLGDVADNPSRLFVAVLASPADRALLEPLASRDFGSELLAAGSRVAYLWVPGSVADSAATKALDRALRDRQTTRNWATMLKIQALLAGA
jgi:uncharacterized protein (DUF1697 family)